MKRDFEQKLGNKAANHRRSIIIFAPTFSKSQREKSQFVRVDVFEGDERSYSRKCTTHVKRGRIPARLKHHRKYIVTLQ